MDISQSASPSSEVQVVMLIPQARSPVQFPLARAVTIEWRGHAVGSCHGNLKTIQRDRRRKSFERVVGCFEL
jgi:hypothetical protein